MKAKLAVIGNPIEHSLSPLVYELFAKEFSIDLECIKILAHSEEDFAHKVIEFFAEGGLALNITSPFKHAAYKLIPQHIALAQQGLFTHSSRAKFCQTSNFIYTNKQCSNHIQVDKRLIVDTTDGIGLLQDLSVNYGIDIAHKNILILGSGFVLDSVLLDIIAANPAHVTILARNKERLKYLQQKFGITPQISDIEFDAALNFVQSQVLIENTRNNESLLYDIIINTIPASVELIYNQLSTNDSNNTDNNKPNHVLDCIGNIRDNAVCYDMAYSKSNFLDYMRHKNTSIKCLSGIGMLVEQAAVAFARLFGHMPNTKTVIQKLHHHCQLSKNK